MPDYPDKFVAIPNYSVLRTDRHGRGGGVAIYLKAHYRFTKLFSSTPQNVLEQLWLIVTYRRRKVAIGIIYRPPNTNVDICLSELSIAMDQAYLESNTVILLGDININLLDLNSVDTKRFNRFLDNFDLCQIIKDPARITSNTETLIDIICISKDIIITNSGTLDLLNITDHMMTFCEINIEEEKVRSETIYYRNYKNFDHNSFAIDAMYNTPWANIYNVQDLNHKVELLNTYITTLFDNHVPVCSFTKKYQYRPYITYNIRQMIKIKNKAHLKYLKTKTRASREYYVTLRNTVNEAIKQEKKAYMQFVLNENKGNNKLIWKKLTDYCGVGTQSGAVNINNIPNELLQPQKINDYFLKVAGPSKVDDNLLSFYNDNRLNPNLSFTFKLINNDDILNALKTIKSQALGVDNINIKMLLIIVPYCVDILKHIFNESITHGVLPDIWKIANVIPIPKISIPLSYKHINK